MLANGLKRITSVFSSGEARQIAEEIRELQRMYTQRSTQFAEWSSLLSMDDILEQKDMESFVGNDPRTTWNMGTFLLQPKPLVCTVISNDGGPLPDDIVSMTQQVGRFFDEHWLQLNSAKQSPGVPDWYWGLIGLFTATGWYGLQHSVGLNSELRVNYLNPAIIFPEYDQEGQLIRLALTKVLTNYEAKRKARTEGYNPDSVKKEGNVVESELWKLQDNLVYKAILFDSNLVQPLQVVEGLKYIPVTIGIVGSVPKFTAISQLDNIVGESILATNAKVFRTFNRQQTFMQQVMRDTASPRITIASTDGRNKIKPEDWNKRGAMFNIGINDLVRVVDMPAMPVEMIQSLFSIRNQIQRGGFSDLVFGNVLTEVTGVLMSQAAESAMQLMYPYHQGIQTGLSEVTNCWYQTILDYGEIKPSGWPDNIDRRKLKDTKIRCHYNVHIPGDLSARIQMAKMLNNNFELPEEDVARLLIPEAGNARDLMQRREDELARRTPQYITIQLIQSFEIAAQQAAQDGNQPMRELLLTTIGGLKAQLGVTQTPADRMGTAGQEGISSQPVSPADIRMGTVKNSSGRRQ
jgi:hypothetical protein